MHSPVIVIGGWGILPDILKCCFGDNACYIDCNRLMPMIISNALLRANWIEIIKSELSLNEKSSYHLAGWSTGAIWAFALATKIKVTSLTLLAPTLSFCRRGTYRYGVRSSVLTSMINSLGNDPATVLKQFYRSCGLDIAPPIPLPWTQAALTDGLHFLSQVDLRVYRCTAPSAGIIHGAQDTVIPHAAGIMVAAACGAQIHTIDGGHAFFTNYTEETRSVLDLYNQKDVQ